MSGATLPESQIATTVRTPGPLTLAELSAILHAVEPAALLVPPRLLRRIIHEDRAGLHLGLHIPHRKSHLISRAALLQIVDREDLPIPPGQELAETVILLTAPDPDDLASEEPALALARCWRLLFHAAVHQTLERRFDELPADTLGQRLACLGASQLNEVQTVLEQESYLHRSSDARAVYIEFAAVYLELRAFDAPLLACYFPGITDWRQIDELLAEDIDAAAVLARTRLPGAAEPQPSSEPEADELDDEEVASSTVPDRPGWLGRLVERVTALWDHDGSRPYRRFMRRAKKASRRGNTVRAAILRTAAVRVADDLEQTSAARTAAHTELDHLLSRLQAALGIDSADLKVWRRPLNALFEPAAASFWPVEARLLYDLQKVCIDHERAIYAIDFMEWLLSWGRRPIKRPLPHEQLVRMIRHLRVALRHLGAVHLPENLRHTLAGLLRAALHQNETRLRQRLRGELAGVFETVGMRPANFPESVARDKLVEELLDHVSERGHLAMGDVRDAMSRNNLKLPDLAGAGDFFRGDRLLQSNRRLANTLDGIYRRGEVYLRWLQRLSAAAFATAVGRFLTRYVALPFGGAFVALKGVEEIINLGRGAVGLHHLHLANRYAILSLGVFLFAVLYVGPFRKLLVQICGLLYHAGRLLFYELPAFLLHLPAVQTFLNSRLVVLFRRYVLRPLVLTALAALASRQAGLTWPSAGGLSAAVFVGSYLLLNSRLGRQLDEAATDWLIRTGRRFLGDLLPGIIRLILDASRVLLRDVERVLYTVDEWLRFRQGESQATLVAKAVLSVGWFFATYLIRIWINLMIEPTFNPVKHFPVVTVAAKIITPLSFKMGRSWAPLVPLLPYKLAYPLVMGNLWLLPGFFGFLVWELKENWRLYRANRPRLLPPVVLGHHGENMLRLLRPGIHSGTIPKLYARLRKAERRARQSGRWKAVRRHRHALEELHTSLRRFAEREFLPLIHASSAWEGVDFVLIEVRTATNRVQLDFGCQQMGAEALQVTFTLQNHALTAGASEPSWLAQLTTEQMRVLRVALAGLKQMAGVASEGEALT